MARKIAIRICAVATIAVCVAIVARFLWVGLRARSNGPMDMAVYHTTHNIQVLRMVCRQYRQDTGAYPSNREALWKLSNMPMYEVPVGYFRDGWNNDIMYSVENGEPRFLSIGRDGKEGTADDVSQ